MAHKYDAIKTEDRQELDSLVCRLSPENLCCDGELSRRQVQTRYNQIIREWNNISYRLKKEIGITVDPDDYENWMFTRQ